MDSIHAKASTSKPTYKLSCTLCRSRKIKCDRVHPCVNCVRAAVECVFPERKRMQRPRKTKNSELLNRISRLESIVGNVNLATLQEADIADIKNLSELKLRAETGGKPEAQPAVPQEFGSTPKDSQLAPGPTHPSKFIGSEFWANLSGEVEGLKQALAQSTDSDTDEDEDTTSPESVQQSKQTFATQGLLAGYPSPESTRSLIHPPQHHIQFLVSIFVERVDPIIKILHKPTILEMIKGGTSALSDAQEALQFSIYFAAVSSLSGSECLAQLGQDHMTVVKAYQLDAERSLAAADYLNNNDIECLQALLIYIACLRVHDESRSSWVLTATLLRLAQAHNLSRDGDGSRFPPFEAEMRRRLWWQVVVLDIRASEDRGTDAMIATDSYNTRMPLNINDSDFGPNSKGPLIERTEPTDMTFSLSTAHASSIFSWVVQEQARFSSGNGPQQSQSTIIAKAQDLEAKFVRNGNPAHYESSLAAGLTRLITLKLWLLIQYPVHVATSTGDARLLPRVPKEAVLQSTIGIMELHEAKQHSSATARRSSWWGTTYVQWHPLAVALAELCTQVRGPLVEKAWANVEVVYPKWAKTVADSKRGALWRPIRKLYKKAKEARARAMQQDAQALAGFEMLSSDAVLGDVLGLGVRTQSSDTTSNTSPAAVDSSFGSATIPLPAGLEGGQFSADVPMMTPPNFFTDSGSGWPDISFDMPLEPPVEDMNWGVWNEFLDDTYADSGSRTGSSEDNF